MGLKGLGLAFGDEFVNRGSKRSDALGDVAVVRDNEFGCGRSAFGPRKNVDDQLVYRPVAEECFLVGDLEFAHGGEEGEGAMAKHLGRRHFSPAGALICLNRVEAVQ